MAKKQVTVRGNKVLPIQAEKKLPQKSDNEVLEEVKMAYEKKYLKPSQQVIASFSSYKFTQLDLEYLIKYGDRNKKYDYEKKGRVIYGVSVVDKDQKSFYGQFDLKTGSLVTLEKIEVV
jgi:hypothetical protein